MRYWICILIVTLAACGPGDGDERPAPRYTDDLTGIEARGTLRVLVEVDDDQYLPRRGDPLVREREIAREFARRRGLEVEFVSLDRFADLVPALLEGRGDVLAANLTVTDARSERVAFTQPIDRSHETVVAAADSPVPSTIDDMDGTIGVRRGTSFLETAELLAAEHDAVDVRVFEGSIGNEDVLDSLVAGVVDYTIQDSNRLDVLLGYREGIRRGPVITSARPLAWAVRPDNPALLQALDAFLFELHLLQPEERIYVEDLSALRERGHLRMITRNNAATYFLWRGQLMGFEYELAKKFAADQGLRLEVVVAPSHDDLLPMLRAGEGDFAAAFLTPTDERRDAGVAFSRPYHWASEVLVGRRGEAAIDSIADLGGRTVTVRRSSAYWTHLEALRDSTGIDFELRAAPADMETEAILHAVGEGEIDLTVADSHLLELEMTIRDDIAGLLTLGEPQGHAWAVHPDNRELLAAIDAYFDQQVRGLFYNMRYTKYFERVRHLSDGGAELRGDGSISPYDDLVRRTAEAHGFDWRLVVAQMYQESRFDPDAESWAGARGLMQVLPRTAQELGIDDLHDPEKSIEAGLRYLEWVRERFPASLDPAERMWFTLAGYNAGHGHVRDARRLARRLGYDPDRWLGHVEHAMLKLSEPEHANRARHGFVRGREPVQYVRSIRDRYRAYVELLRNGTR
ncbi:MAG TPA: transporter substrate-binding domain-containing protein [Candidatus Krumholzibacteria bacterium]|nr:transporter substrate-binding domain-containing protein [Candidatus Krumholzibacteria bacterium]